MLLADVPTFLLGPDISEQLFLVQELSSALPRPRLTPMQGRSSGHSGVFSAPQWFQIVALVQVSSYVTDGS